MHPYECDSTDAMCIFLVLTVPEKVTDEEVGWKQRSCPLSSPTPAYNFYVNTMEAYCYPYTLCIGEGGWWGNGMWVELLPTLLFSFHLLQRECIATTSDLPVLHHMRIEKRSISLLLPSFQYWRGQQMKKWDANGYISHYISAHLVTEEAYSYHFHASSTGMAIDETVRREQHFCPPVKSISAYYLWLQKQHIAITFIFAWPEGGNSRERGTRAEVLHTLYWNTYTQRMYLTVPSEMVGRMWRYWHHLHHFVKK